MAQTITIQKGTVACNWALNSTGTGTPSQTIFTQSTGIGARVILNSMELSTTSGAASYIGFYIVNGTTGIASMISYIRNDNAYPNFGIVPQQQNFQGYYNGASMTNTSLIYANASGTPRANLAGDNPSGIALLSSTGTNKVFHFPGNFWIANGDSLVVRGYWDATGNVYYNFTVITES
jgi:hypothetical protein